MLVKDRYDSSRDAAQQLHNTYVVLDGEILHIEQVDGWEYASRGTSKRRDGSLTWKTRRATINIRNMDLQLEPIKLGYVNYRGNAYYLQRKPLRKWKQGLYGDYLRIKRDENRVAAVKKNGGIGIGKLAGMPHPKQVLQTPEFLQMFLNKYDSFYRAWTQVRLLQKDGCAFSRNWAFTRERKKELINPMGDNNDYFLEYKGTRVGVVDEDTVTILNDYKYLSEDFVEAMINAS
jgi:hypothetical protein